MKPWDLVIVGGGTAGLTAAVGAAGLGARVLLVERDRTGGDCLWAGCVPSKALLSVAERAHLARSSSHVGVEVDGLRVDFTRAMAHVRDAIARIEPHDSPARLESAGVVLRHGHARFVAADAIEIDGRRERFFRAMVATGSTPVVPDLPGLRASHPLTTDTVWDLEELPRRLVVLGGGAVGCELGQAFSRLGSTVTIVETEDGLLPREEPEARRVLAEQLRAEGVDVRTATRAVRAGDGALLVDGPTGRDELGYDRLLVAVGRAPRTSGLGLDHAEVAVDERGAVEVDERLRTTNPRIFAGGDVTLRLPFTHVAAAHGTAVVQNALFGLRATVAHERIPWVTFTSPEVARVGLSVAQARERFGDPVIRTVPHREVDRAVAAGETDGFATLVGDRRGRIVGATVVGPRAGEVIGEVAAWMATGSRISRIVRTTHAYPTWNADLVAASLAELRAAVRRVGPLPRLVLWMRRALRR